MFLWLSLPPGLAAGRLLRAAVAAGVSFVPGTAFHADGMGVHSARLNFASSSLAEIAEGIQVLAGLITERMAAGGAFA